MEDTTEAQTQAEASTAVDLTVAGSDPKSEGLQVKRDQQRVTMLQKKRTRKTTLALLAGASLIAGPAIAACGSSGPSYEEWAATDGAAGRINLDEVQKAFEDAESPTDFEKRVNEIYEGDGVVIIRVEQDGDRMNLEGWEDLNKSKGIEDASDDRLFSIVRDHNREHEMRGYGANSYYRSHFGAGDFLFTYMLLSAFTPMGGYYYRTPINRYDTISRDRTNYRNSGSYRSQVSKNSSYFSKQKSFAGSSYDQASRNVSSSRQTYMNNQKTTGSFKSSSTGVRSSWGGSSRGSSFGRASSGFTGGGGSTRLTGFTRPSLRQTEG